MSAMIKPLLSFSAIEAPPKYLQTLEDAGKFVKQLKETDPDIVNSAANRSGTEDERRGLQAGLLYLALTEPDHRRSQCTDIVLTARDNLNYALSELTRLVAEAWPKMTQSVRKNLLGILTELIGTRGASVEVLMLHLYRRMPTGDLSSSNLWLAETLVDLLIRNKEWLESMERQQFLLPLTVYTFLRIIPDHFNATSSPSSTTSSKSSVAADSSNNNQSVSTTVVATLLVLRQRESTFIVDLIRKNFDKCSQLGRDLVRMLHTVSRFDPFQRLWHDIFNDIASLSCQIKSITSVLDITTPQFFVQTLIPHEMETWIRWMLRNVQCSTGFPVRRYQEFFNRKFFSTQESQSLRVCLTRYIVDYFYPDNEMLASALIPRWNVVSWLISQCICPIATYNIKMALFFDWLFFKPNDCIMNVEPAMLAITNNLSVRSQPFGLSLVAFLTKASTAFYPSMSENITTSVRAGLEDMLRLGVVRSINPLLDVLLRVSPDIYRNFNTLIGPLVDSTLPIPSVPSTPITLSPTSSIPCPTTSAIAALPTATTNEMPPGLRPASPDVLEGRPRIPSVSSTSSSKSKRESLPTSPAPVICSNATSMDPRLRRITLPVLIKTGGGAHKNGGPQSGVYGDESRVRGIHLRPPSPPSPPSYNLTSSFTPVPDVVVMEKPSSTGVGGLLSAEDLKQLMADARIPPLPIPGGGGGNKQKTRPYFPPALQSNHPLSSPIQKIPSADFENLPSPEYRYTNSNDSMQQRIDDLRCKYQSYQFRYKYNVDTNADVRTLISLLDGPIRGSLEGLVNAAKGAGLFEETETNKNSDSNSSTPNSDDADLADMCEAMEIVVQSVLADDGFDTLEIAGRTAAVVCQICLPLFEIAPPSVSDTNYLSSPSGGRMQRVRRDPLPSHLPITEEQISESLASPVFVPLRHLCEMSRGDPKRELLLLLLTEMQTRQPRLGYHLLYFLTVSKVNDEKMTAYRNFCASQENPNLLASLHRDMQLLADDNRFLFCYLLPSVYSVFANDLANNTDFIRLIVGKIDPSQANYLVCEILRGHLNFFNRPNITDVLKASLEWTSMEQFFFWQLINAHELPTRNFLPLISLVDGQKHPEACSHLLLLLQLEKPTNEVVRLLLSRASQTSSGGSGLGGIASGMGLSTTSDDLLSVTALHYWGCPGRQNAQRFAEILGGMLTTAVNGLKATEVAVEESGAPGREKKRNGVKNSNTSEYLSLLVSILVHLDCMRKKCKNIAMLEAMELQSALQQVIHSSGVPAHVKDRFAELLTLVEDDNLDMPQRSLANLTRSGRTDSGDINPSSPTAATTVVGSKGGHSLRNLDSRRAAEAERRRTAASNLKKPRKQQGNSSGSEDEDDENENSRNGDEEDDEDDSEGALAIDDEDGNEMEDGKASSSSSTSSSDDDGGDLPMKRRRELNTSRQRRQLSSTTTVNRRSISKKTPEESSLPILTRGGRRKGVTTSRRTAPASSLNRKTSVLDSDDDVDDDEVEEEEENEEEDEEDGPAPKRRKAVGRRVLLDD